MKSSNSSPQTRTSIDLALSGLTSSGNIFVPFQIPSSVFSFSSSTILKSNWKINIFNRENESKSPISDLAINCDKPSTNSCCKVNTCEEDTTSTEGSNHEA